METISSSFCKIPLLHLIHQNLTLRHTSCIFAVMPYFRLKVSSIYVVPIPLVHIQLLPSGYPYWFEKSSPFFWGETRRVGVVSYNWSLGPSWSNSLNSTLLIITLDWQWLDEWTLQMQAASAQRISSKREEDSCNSVWWRPASVLPLFSFPAAKHLHAHQPHFVAAKS